MLLATFVGLTALPGQAEGACVDRGWLVRELALSHGERPAAAGVTAEGERLEVLASPDGGTWTLLLTGPDGLTCTLIEGRDLRLLSPLLALRKDGD